MSGLSIQRLKVRVNARVSDGSNCCIDVYKIFLSNATYYSHRTASKSIKKRVIYSVSFLRSNIFIEISSNIIINIYPQLYTRWSISKET